MTNFGGELQFEGSDLEVRRESDPNYPLERLAPADLRTSSYPLPLNFQVGIGFDILNYDFIKIIGGIDAVHPNDNKERVQLGTQISVFDRFFIRGGYLYNHDTENYALGFGANLPMGNTLIQFDYSYSNYNILPAVHRISLSMNIL
jgi:hypothetical protein